MSFTTDWVKNNIRNWTAWLKDVAGKPGMLGVEIGTYEGQSACWFLRNVLTAPGSMLFCVDIAMPPVLKDNLEEAGVLSRVIPHQCRSAVFWARLVPVQVDFIYIDGGHGAKDVLEDSVSAWAALRPGGVIIWDDYLLPPDAGRPSWDCPKPSIDSFLATYQGEYDLLEPADSDPNPGWQKAVRKKL